MKNGMKERALKGRELIVVMMEHSRNGQKRRISIKF